MKASDKEEFSFSKQNNSYHFVLDKTLLIITIEDKKSQCIYQGQYSNDNLPQAFSHIYQNVNNLFMSLKATDHQCFNLQESTLIIQIFFVNFKKKLLLHLQKMQEPLENKQRKKIQRLQQKVQILQNQLVKKDLIIKQQAKQIQKKDQIIYQQAKKIQNLTRIVQNGKLQKPIQIIQRLKTQNKKIIFNSQVQRLKTQNQKFILNDACKFTNKYFIKNGTYVKTQQSGNYYQLFGQKLEKNKRFQLKIRIKKLNNQNAIGIGIQTNQNFNQRQIKQQQDVILFYGFKRTIYALKNQFNNINLPNNQLVDSVIKMMVQNKEKIQFYMNQQLLYKQILQQGYSKNELYPFFQLRDVNDEIQIIDS